MDQRTLKSAEILVDLAIAEDLGIGDITTSHIIQPGKNKTAIFKVKSFGIIAGLEIAEMVFRKLDKNLVWEVMMPDGSHVKPGDVIVVITGDYRTLLTGERTALNFIQRLSGIASYTHRCVKEVENTSTKILDTRKTLPAYRLLDKYAVQTGGASNHRMGLYDMVMIKDNHIQVAGGIKQAVESIRPHLPVSILIEVETTSLGQVEEAIEAGADIIMLDNMETNTIKEAVKLINKKAKTEASGNMSIVRLKEIASTGVDYISIGGLTHSVTALDISLEIID